MIARCGPIPNRNKCMIDDCERIQKVRGMCSPHYMKWYHRGGKEEPKLKASNLVVCPDQTYHAELHQRMKRLGISFK